ncbi:MAG: protein-tyrosine-phosphatase [Bacteroidota bacterium]
MDGTMNSERLNTLPLILQKYVSTLPDEYQTIPEERQQQLSKLSQYIRGRQLETSPTQVTVICTHNSRRSHLGQIWLQLAAYCYDVPHFQSFSGGTEATAFHPNAVVALQRAGVSIQKSSPSTTSSNPIYQVQFVPEISSSFDVFSKVYHTAPNPSSQFAAVMVCDSADEACPVVPGADARFSLPFDDPKAFDNTSLQAAKYDERTRQIAREFFFVIHKACL